MTEQELEQQIIDLGLTAPRVTLADINELMARVEYHYEQPEGTTSTFCHGYLDGFYLASGFSACASPENFNVELGKGIAFHDAEAKVKNKLWELEGYRLWCDLKARKAHAEKYAHTGYADYQIRVLHERDQIRERLFKLTAYLETTPENQTFNQDRMYMQQQRFTMEQYVAALEQRIALFTPVQAEAEA